MITRFSVKNFGSIKDEYPVFLTKTKEEFGVDTLSEDATDKDIVIAGGVHNSLVFYGANGSGKSTVVNALKTMFNALACRTDSCQKITTVSDLNIKPHARTPNEQTELAFTAVIDGNQYDYFLDVKHDLIVSETITINNEYGFSREYDEATGAMSFQFGTDENRASHDDHRVQAFVGTIMMDPNCTMRMFGIHCDAYSEFYTDLHGRLYPLIRFVHETGTHALVSSEYTPRFSYLREDKTRLKFLALLKTFDLNIDNVSFPNNFADKDLIITKTAKPKDDQTFTLRYHDLSGNERTLISLCLELCLQLQLGGMLILDGVFDNLHPKVVSAIMGIVENKELNREGMQVIATTLHNTQLMDEKVEYNTRRLLHRSQVYFCQMCWGLNTVIYPLSQYKNTFEGNESKAYLNGRLGAIPNIQALDFEQIMRELYD